jgi:hypothetical protein
MLGDDATGDQMAGERRELSITVLVPTDVVQMYKCGQPFLLGWARAARRR